MKAASVGAVVVTWNSERDIRACLNSLLKQTRPLNQIIVVDNASSDSTVAIIRAEFPNIRLLPQTSNTGFAEGNNIGIDQTDAEWVLLLNPDARLAVDWIEQTLNLVEGRQTIGALGGLLLREGGRGGVIDSTGIEIYRSRRVKDRQAGDPVGEAPRLPERVFGICAAAVLFRRAALDATKMEGEVFPSRFFSYYEDADLAWRMWRMGWEAWYVPEAVGWHRRGGSPVGAKFSRALTQRNRWWMIIRNDRFSSWIRALPTIFAHECIILARSFVYPNLWNSNFECVAGLRWAFKSRSRLVKTNLEAPPFKRGIGFSTTERKSAINRLKKS